MRQPLEIDPFAEPKTERRWGWKSLVLLLLLTFLVVTFGPAVWIRLAGPGWLETKLSDILRAKVSVGSMEGSWFQPLVANDVTLESAVDPATRVKLSVQRAALSVTFYGLTFDEDALLVSLGGVEVDLRSAEKEPPLDRFLDRRLPEAISEPGRRLELSLHDGRVVLNDAPPYRLDVTAAWDGDLSAPVSFNASIEHEQGDRLDVRGRGRPWADAGPELSLDARVRSWRIDPWQPLVRRVLGLHVEGLLEQAAVVVPDLANHRGRIRVDAVGREIAIALPKGQRRRLGALTLLAEGGVVGDRVNLESLRMSGDDLFVSLDSPGWIEPEEEGFLADLRLTTRSERGQELFDWVPGGRRADFAVDGPASVSLRFVGRVKARREGGFEGLTAGSLGLDVRARDVRIAERNLSNVQFQGEMADGVLTVSQGGATFAGRRLLFFGGLGLDRADPSRRLEWRLQEGVSLAVGMGGTHLLEGTFQGGGALVHTDRGFEVSCKLVTPGLRVIAANGRAQRGGRADVAFSALYHPTIRRWEEVSVTLDGPATKIEFADGTLDGTTGLLNGALSATVPRRWATPWLGADDRTESEDRLVLAGRLRLFTIQSLSDLSGRFEGRLAAPRLRISGHDFENVSATVVAEAGLIQFTDAVAELNPGQMNGRVTVALSDESAADGAEPLATVALRGVAISSLDPDELMRVHPLLRVLGDEAELTGTIDGALRFSHLGPSAQAEGELHFTGGTIRGSWLLSEVAARFSDLLEPDQAGFIDREFPGDRHPTARLRRLATDGFVVSAADAKIGIVSGRAISREPFTLISNELTFTARAAPHPGEVQVAIDLMDRLRSELDPEKVKNSPLATMNLIARVVWTQRQDGAIGPAVRLVMTR